MAESAETHTLFQPRPDQMKCVCGASNLKVCWSPDEASRDCELLHELDVIECSACGKRYLGHQLVFSICKGLMPTSPAYKRVREFIETLEHASSGRWFVWQVRGELVVQSPSHFVSTVYRQERADHAANALLMAAAPEMVELLTQLSVALDQALDEIKMLRERLHKNQETGSD